MLSFIQFSQAIYSFIQKYFFIYILFLFINFIYYDFHCNFRLLMEYICLETLWTSRSPSTKLIDLEFAKKIGISIKTTRLQLPVERGFLIVGISLTWPLNWSYILNLKRKSLILKIFYSFNYIQSFYYKFWLKSKLIIFFNLFASNFLV